MLLPESILPLVIRGWPFTCRTFAEHGKDPEMAWLDRYETRVRRLDHLVIVTLPYVEGYGDTAPTMQVHLYGRETEIRHRHKAGEFVDGRRKRQLEVA